MVESLQPQSENSETSFDKVQVLREVRLFSPLDQEDLEKIAGYLEERRYLGGDVVYRHGDEGDAMYIVRSGRVTASLNPDAPEQITAIFIEKEYFGEMSLLSDAPRSATMRVSSPTADLLVLPKEGFEEILAANLRVMRQFVNLMSGRLADTTTRTLAEEEPIRQSRFNTLSEAVRAIGYVPQPQFDENGKLASFELVKSDS